MKTTTLTALATTTALALAVGSANAATITWGEAVDIVDDVSQISTNGTLHQSAAGSNLGGGGVTGASVTVNGVTFLDNETLDAPTHNDFISSATGVTGDYNTLLNDGDRVRTGDAALTFTGLTIGTTYEIQFWASDTRNTAQDGLVLNNGGTDNSPDAANSDHATVLYDVTPGSSPGQFVIGTFTADSPSQSLLVRRWDNFDTTPTASFQTLVQAWQVRAISEPSPLDLALTITAATAPATGFDLEWESQAGKIYNLRTTTDLAGPIDDWDLVRGDIEATPPANVENVDSADPQRFYVIEEVVAPPSN